MYKPVDPKASFPALERAVLQFWQDNEIFEKSVEATREAAEFVQFDGPPFATGLPHYGHLIQSAIKDTMPRYKTMRGYHVERRWGWDCHGLPVEYEMEKELGISGKTEIEKFGIAKFSEECRKIVLRYAVQWRDYINRLGRWTDFDNGYKTMDPAYMESVWSLFKQLWENGMVEKGHYILPYCPRCSTPLSSHELNIGGYKEVTDQAVFVRFALTGQNNTYFLAWTTTPWTLPSNLALAVGPEIVYVKIAMKNEGEPSYYILAKSRLEAVFNDSSAYTILEEMPGRALKNLTYKPLFNYFASLADEGAFRVFTADYVDEKDGSGIVHTASGFGEDDYNLLKETGLPVVAPIDDECRFTAEIPAYEGRFVKECDKDIIKRLQHEGSLLKKENYTHNYPHCWRCQSPLIYRAIVSWFVKASKLRARMLAANAQIAWTPAHIQHGRFGKWLENARDWAISRNRYWGNPIPIWSCEACGKIQVIGSRAELKELSGHELDDLHKHFADLIEFPCSCGGCMKRIPEVFDCWFESGAMPYAQNHWPFQDKNRTEANLPADFIAEGIDQTRGWFYTLTVLASALFDRPAFKKCIATGIVLAADGQKMSKSKRNFTDPMEIVEQYGADAVRLYLQNSPLTRGEDLKFSDEGVKDAMKSIILPLWNAYGFFVTYANIDKIEPQEGAAPSHPLDQWALSALRKLIGDVESAMEEADLQKAIAAISLYIDNLNNWYIRRSRRRFWKSDNDTDKMEAYQTLYEVLMALIKTAAPFMPFVCEEIYQNLRKKDAPESVHLCSWPQTRQDNRLLELEDKMSLAMRTAAMGRALRNAHNLKTRLPLRSVYLVSRDSKERAVLKEMENIILEELNVKEALIKENEEDLVEYKAKANFKILGKTLGADMKAAAAAIEALESEAISALLDGAALSVSFAGKEYSAIEITQNNVIIQRIEKSGLKTANDGSLTVALDTTVNEELKMEGAARDLIRAIQNLRKERGLEVSDRIKLFVLGSEQAHETIKIWESLIKNETLALELQWQQGPNPERADCGDDTVTIDLEKVQTL